MSSIFNKLLPSVAQGASRWIGYGSGTSGGAGSIPMRDSGIASFKVPTDSIATISYPSGGVEATVGAPQAEDTSLLTYSDLVEAPVSGGVQGSTTAVFNLATSFRNYYLLDQFICYADVTFGLTNDCPLAPVTASGQPGGSNNGTNVNTAWYAITNQIVAGVPLKQAVPVASRPFQVFLSSPEFIYSWFNQIQFRYGNTVIQQWVNPTCDVILRVDAPHNQLTRQGKRIADLNRGIQCGAGLFRRPEFAINMSSANYVSGTNNAITVPRLRWKLCHPFEWTPAKTLPSGAIHSLGITFYYANSSSNTTNTHFFGLSPPGISMSTAVATNAIALGSNPIYDTSWGFTKNYITSISNFNISSLTISQNSTYHDVSPVLDLQMNIPIVNWQLIATKTYNTGSNPALPTGSSILQGETLSIVFESRFPQFLAIVSEFYCNIGSGLASPGISTKLTGVMPLVAIRALRRNNNEYARWRWIEDQITRDGAPNAQTFTALVRQRNAEISGIVWNCRADVDENDLGGNLFTKSQYYDNQCAANPSMFDKLSSFGQQPQANTPALTNANIVANTANTLYGINLQNSEYNYSQVCISNQASANVTNATIPGPTQLANIPYTRQLMAERVTYCPVIQPHDAIKLNNTGNGTLKIIYDVAGATTFPIPALIPGLNNEVTGGTVPNGTAAITYNVEGTPQTLNATLGINLYVYAAYYNNVTLGNNVEAVQQDMSDIFSTNRAI
jgi:hypothetical protein